MVHDRLSSESEDSDAHSSSEGDEEVKVKKIDKLP